MKSLRSNATVVLALTFSGAILFAEPPAKPAAQTSNAHSTLIAAELRLQLPDLSTNDCPRNPLCQQMGPGEKQMLEMINADRMNPANDAETGGRTNPLKWDRKLAQAAVAHSQDMANSHYFSHFDPNGNSPVERFYHAGVLWLSMGENIAKDPSVAHAEEDFMNEPRFQSNHRSNILSRKFNYVGIGIVRGTDGLLYVTQDFAQEP